MSEEEKASAYAYGTWRDDKETEPGFSRELISADFKYIQDQTTVDELHALAYPGIDTVYKAMQRNVRRTPNETWLGTRVADSYEWLSWRDVAESAENIGYGLKELDLIPEM